MKISVLNAMLYVLFFAAEMCLTWHQIQLFDAAGEPEDEPAIIICEFK
jgi:hypothetical protein